MNIRLIFLFAVLAIVLLSAMVDAEPCRRRKKPEEPQTGQPPAGQPPARRRQSGNRCGRNKNPAPPAASPA